MMIRFGSISWLVSFLVRDFECSKNCHLNVHSCGIVHCGGGAIFMKRNGNKSECSMVGVGRQAEGENFKRKCMHR